MMCLSLETDYRVQLGRRVSHSPPHARGAVRYTMADSWEPRFEVTDLPRARDVSKISNSAVGQLLLACVRTRRRFRGVLKPYLCRVCAAGSCDLAGSWLMRAGLTTEASTS